MDLPVELWMKSLEYTTIDRNYNVRATFILPFTKVLRESPESEQDLVRKLPKLEHTAWVQAKKYYHINHRSRAAASKLNFTRKFLHGCPIPWSMMPAHNFEVSEERTCITIRMFDREHFHYHIGGLMRISRLYCDGQMFKSMRMETLGELAIRSDAQNFAMQSHPLLKTIKHVRLLSAPPTSSLYRDAFKSTQRLRAVVEQT